MVLMLATRSPSLEQLSYSRFPGVQLEGGHDTAIGVLIVIPHPLELWGAHSGTIILLSHPGGSFVIVPSSAFRASLVQQIHFILS